MRTDSGRRSRSFRLEQLEPRVLLAADLYISEFVAANDSTLVDEDGDSPDWVEIYNPGPDDVTLAGWYLTDDAAQLRKWSFPARDLSAGSFLVVYASDKDRAASDGPLHTNFKLTSKGEYLALARDNPQSNEVEIVSEFTPDFPAQFPDISYGLAQDVTINKIISADDAARVLFPTNASLGTSWKDLNFNDSGWAGASASIGYQLAVPGFTVEDAKSSSNLLNLSEAIAVLDGSGQVSQTTTVTQVVNFVDSEGGGGVGNFSNDLDFPNNRPVDDNDFALRATGTITIPTTGDWTFGINSDDGARLRIDGRNVINDDTTHAPRDTFGTTFLTTGQHDIELVFFERGGGAEVELFAAPGRLRRFDNSFRLVGDVRAGGLAVATSPTGDVTKFGALIGTDVTTGMYQQSSSAYLRIPFSVADPHALRGLTLSMNFDDGFVTYLNGTEVARRNAPPAVSHSAVAAINRHRGAAEFVQAIDLSHSIDLLNAGSNNVLAIHGLNEAIDGEEFLLRVELAEIEVKTGSPVYFPEPTPHDFNPASGVDGFLTDEIILSQPHGFYDRPFSLRLDSATAGTTIRYTLDGSAPTESNGLRYTSPITIDKTTTVRARAFKTGRDPSFIETATYIFLADVLQQSPRGSPPPNFPRSTRINGQTLDYGMDPDIVNDSRWGPQLLDALRQVPSLSIVMDVDDLLGSQNGIYTHAHSHGKAWERPASLELIHPDGSEGFQVETGVRIRGGFSRSGSNPKHAFRLFFREEYGDAKLEFPLFGEEGADEFDKIDLRTTQNYSWAFQGSGDNAFVRDIFSRDVHRDMGQPYTRSRYYHLYLNGQYWGLFQTQERAEARYAATYFGGNPEDYDVIKSAGNSGGYQNEATDGNMDAYRRLADFFYQAGGLGDSKSHDYYRVQGLNPDGSENPNYEKLLDVDNLIDYMIIAYYTGDRDAPVSRFVPEKVNNYFAIFNRKDPDGFKFFEHDSEHTLDRGWNDLVSQITSSGRDFRFFNPLWMHEQLAASNREYRMRFADAVYRHFANDGVLTDDNAKALIDARTAEFDLAMIAESARWGDAKTRTPFDQDDWRAAVSRAKRFLDNRAHTVIDQFRAQGWYPASNPPQFQVQGSRQHGGEVLPTDDITLLTIDTLVFQPIVSTKSTWKYLDNGSNQRTGWRSPNFNDSSWSSGRGQLGYGDGDESTRVRFGSNSSNKHVTTYFRKSFDVANPREYQTLKLRVLRDDGAVVYLNGQEVARSNMPSGTIRYDTFAAGVVGGGDESSFQEFEVDAGLLVSGKNVLAVEIHQANSTSSDISFDLELLGGQASSGAATIYYTLDGSDPRSPGGAPSSQAILYSGRPLNLSATTEIKARSFELNAWSALAVATFTVDGSAMPSAADDALQVREGGTATTLMGGAHSLLANDTGLDDTPVSVSLQSPPQYDRTFALNSDGTFRYVHDGSENFIDSFAYRVTDAAGASATATVAITIDPVSDTTPDAIPDKFFADEGSVAFNPLGGATNVLGNDLGLSDTPLTVALAGAPRFATRFTLGADGNFTYVHDGSENFLDSFVYRITDNDGQSDTAQVNITVNRVSDATPAAINDELRVLQGGIATALVDDAKSVLDNDLGIADVPVLVAEEKGPKYAAKFGLNSDGTFSYEHDGSENFSDSFIYRVTDNDGQTATATVVVMITPLSTGTPVAVDDTIELPEGGTVNSLVRGEASVLANDTGLGDPPIQVTLQQAPRHALSFTLASNGTFSYQHNGSENFADAFVYQVADKDGETDTASVSLRIRPVSDSTPSAADDLVTVSQGGTATRLQGDVASVLANDAGLLDRPISIRLEAAPAHAANFNLAADGTFTYTHDGGLAHSDAFVYRITDNDGEQATATVVIEIQINIPAGDLNGDGVVDLRDVRRLVAGISDGNVGPDYDLDKNGSVDAHDLIHIIEKILNTRPGDTDLNGKVDFTDFLKLSSNFGKDPATWEDGTFDLDGQVTFADFLQLAANFGYEANQLIDLAFAEP